MATPTYNGNPESYRPLIESGYNFDLNKYLNKGWSIFTQQFGGFFGFSILAYFITLIGAVIPLVGGFISIAFQGILYGGFFLVAHKISRGDRFEFGDFFKGFDDFLQLGLGNIVKTLIIALPAILIVIGMIAVFGLSAMFLEGDGTQALAPGMLVGVFLLMLPVVYLSVAYSFTIPLIILGRLEFWPAMETSRKIISKRWGNFFVMYLLFVGIYLIGMLMLFIGIFAAMALVYCIQYAAYEDIAGRISESEDQRIDEIGIRVEEVKNFDDV